MLKIPEKLKIWFEVRKKFKLSDAQVQMARELGLNPKKFGSLANSNQETWKLPLPQFIEKIYLKNFGRERPIKVISLEEKLKKDKAKKELQKKEKVAIPENLKNEIRTTVLKKAAESDRGLIFKIKKNYVYLYDEGMPLCRIEYLGGNEIWGFAIYKCSTDSYSSDTFLFPTKNTLEKCIETALKAYD